MNHDKQEDYSPKTELPSAPHPIQAERSEKEGVANVAAGFGISGQLLYTWRRALQQSGKGFEKQQRQQAELNRLKLENARLTEELEFLKKEAAYLCPLGTSRSNPSEVRGDQTIRRATYHQFDVHCLGRITQGLPQLAKSQAEQKNR